MNELSIAIQDGVAAMDREYFENHPGEKVYVRRVVSGEFPAELLEGPVNAVTVTQIEPGVRTRIPGWIEEYEMPG